MIVATAGHVDHGKTSLIARLTGVDTDRLPEEKRRGLTIDLGFAYTTLPDGRELGFVDVPGHERFLRNMLAGVLAVDAVLLIVAADDGPMPQTLEHLAILDLIGVRDVTGVITKIDRVDHARVAHVAASLGELLGDHGFADAPILSVSSETGVGIEQLRAHLATIGTRRVAPGAGFRLAIDRCFTLPGAGTVVTGAVVAGRARVGDLLLLTPGGIQVRVRGIRAQDRDNEAAVAGTRCALAVTGARLDRTRVQRGDWLVTPNLHAPMNRFDARLRFVGEPALRDGMPVHVHLGTSDITGRVTLLGAAETPGTCYAQVTIDRATAALHGDRVIIRDHAARRTLAGGHVLDPSTVTRRRPRAERLRTLRALETGDPGLALAALLDVDGCVDLQAFARIRNVDPTELTVAGCRRIGRAGEVVLVSRSAHATLRAAVLDGLAAWHAARPDSIGPSKAALLQRLHTRATAPVLDAITAELLEAGDVLRDRAALHLPGHAPRLSDADEEFWRQLEPAMASAGLRPPRVRELAEQFGHDPERMQLLLQRYEAFGRLLCIAPNRFFLIETVVALAATAASLQAEADEGGFAAATFARATGVGRNVAIQILEFLDRIGVTRRLGELRHVIRPVEAALG